MRQKIMSRAGGVNRITAILLILIGVMLILIAIPGWQVFRYRSEKTGCNEAMKSAEDGLIIEYLSHWETCTVEDAMTALDEVLPGRPNICPAGGTVYLVRGDNGIFKPVCGLHNDDKKLRVRLNASRGLDLLKENLLTARRASGGEPEAVDIALNGRTLTCTRVHEVLDLRRGTDATNGYKGVVAFYGLAGDGDFPKSKAKKGEIAYFVYADENHAAVWEDGDGWRGDAYTGIRE